MPLYHIQLCFTGTCDLHIMKDAEEFQLIQLIPNYLVFSVTVQ